jgi:glycosyltransferase involved in cell wall biosynthesis
LRRSTYNGKPLSRSQEEALREELERTRVDLRHARAHIAAVEASRFWKLRNVWWRLRERIPRFLLPRTWFEIQPPRHDGPNATLVRAPESSRTSSESSVLRVPDSDLRDLFVGELDGSSRFLLLAPDSNELSAEDVISLIAALRERPLAQAAATLSVDVPVVGVALREAWERLPGSSDARALEIRSSAPRALPVVFGLPSGPVLLRPGVSAFLRGASSRGEIETRFREQGFRSVIADDVPRVSEETGSETFVNNLPSREESTGILTALAARVALIPERARLRRDGRERWAGRRILFILPVAERGGGANVVISEARALRSMGVDVRLFNLARNRKAFCENYPDTGIPIVFGDPGDIGGVAIGFDAVVATAHASVPWLLPLSRSVRPLVLGYYVQDYEALFYPEGSADWSEAHDSYGLVPGLRRFTKTEWNAREVRDRTGLDVACVGPSFDMDLFCPREPRTDGPPLRVAAMIRPSSPRRGPRETMEALRDLSVRFGALVEITLFGVEASDAGWKALPRDFPHRLVGVISDRELSRLLSEADIFVDFSEYQAMGLTAMEAMACGAAVIVPRAGGASSFATDGVNTLIVDTSSSEERRAALERLVVDVALRRRLGGQAALDVVQFYPERSATRLAELLLSEGDLKGAEPREALAGATPPGRAP